MAVRLGCFLAIPRARCGVCGGAFVQHWFGATGLANLLVICVCVCVVRRSPQVRLNDERRSVCRWTSVRFRKAFIDGFRVLMSLGVMYLCTL